MPEGNDTPRIYWAGSGRHSGKADSALREMEAARAAGMSIGFVSAEMPRRPLRGDTFDHPGLIAQEIARSNRTGRVMDFLRHVAQQPEEPGR